MKKMVRGIISLAMSKTTPVARAKYLLKGIVFLPFLALADRRRRTGDDMAKTIEAGEDIYPLF